MAGLSKDAGKPSGHYSCENRHYRWLYTVPGDWIRRDIRVTVNLILIFGKRIIFHEKKKKGGADPIS